MMNKNQKILLCGTFDRQMSQFVHFYKKANESSAHHVHFFGLSPLAYRDIAIDRFLSLSHDTSNETAQIIATCDAAVWFCLTPLPLRKQHDSPCDEQLFDAIRFLQLLKKQPKTNAPLRVVLVIRQFPCNETKKGPIYDHFQRIYQLFTSECKNLSILQISPIISNDDALFTAFYEYTLKHPFKFPASNLSGMNLVSLSTETRLYRAIAQSISEQNATMQFIQGDICMSYRELLDQIQKYTKNEFKWHKSLVLQASSSARTRAEFFNETIEFHTVHASDRHFNRFESQTQKIDFSNFSEQNATSAHLLDATSRHDNTLCIRSVENTTTRSISGISTLLMNWLPNFFKNALTLETLGQKRVICRLSRLPIFEIEQNDASDNLSRLRLFLPLHSKMEMKINLFIAGSPDAHQHFPHLLIVSENHPENVVWHTFFERLVSSFGRFLREYG